MTPTVVMIPLHADADPIIEWLQDNVGAGVVEDRDAWRHPDIEWSLWAYIGVGMLRHVVEFRQPEMATMFKLRWS